MKAIRHAHHEQYLRLSNEDAALLVSSGRWTYASKFQAREAAMKPRHTWPARIAMLGAIVVAILALLLLTTSAHARPCESLATVQKKHPGQHAKYRSVDGRRCWYVGKRVPAKSEFSLPATASSRGEVVTRGAQQPSPKRQDANGFAPILTAVSPAPRETNHAGETPGPSTHAADLTSRASASRRGEPAPDDGLDAVLLVLCGGICPQLMAFDERWQMATGKRR